MKNRGLLKILNRQPAKFRDRYESGLSYFYINLVFNHCAKFIAKVGRQLFNDKS